MPVVLHWFLPTNGDSRTDLSNYLLNHVPPPNHGQI